jgi:hypothetical protein
VGVKIRRRNIINIMDKKFMDKEFMGYIHVRNLRVKKNIGKIIIFFKNI